MTVRESVEIAAPPAVVWAQLVDPQLMAVWHAKLVEVRRSGRGPVQVGERFGTTYIQSHKKQNRKDSNAEVLVCDPWTTLVLRHYLTHKGAQRHVVETYQLHPRDGGRATLVEQTVDFSRSGLPLWARALIWCITRTGERRGEGILEPLKRVCEGEPAAHSGPSER
jgi:uncharacterized protein YndB with AHSA1/START domain